MSAKNWTVTINNPLIAAEDGDDDDLLDLQNDEHIAYYLFCLETAPTTGTLHYQGFVCYDTRRTFAQVMHMMTEGAHVEIMRGSIPQNVAYCTKDGLEPIEYGIRPTGRGHRSDLDIAAQAVIAGQTMASIATLQASTFIRYSRGLRDLAMATYRPTLRLGNNIIVIWGQSGLGKTRYAYDHHSIEEIYKLNTNSNGTLWFDGYNGQPILLIDDFKGWVKFKDLLALLDIYPYLCQIKGSSIYARWTTVYITSDVPPEQWYQNVGDISQLTRRITNVIHMHTD